MSKVVDEKIPDHSEHLRPELRKRLAEIEIEERRLDGAQENLRKGAWEHHDTAQKIAKDAKGRVHIADSDSPDALLYEQALKDQRRAALVGGHLNRTLKGED
jgi:hypothetical protein